MHCPLRVANKHEFSGYLRKTLQRTARSPDAGRSPASGKNPGFLKVVTSGNGPDLLKVVTSGKGPDLLQIPTFRVDAADPKDLRAGENSASVLPLLRCLRTVLLDILANKPKNTHFHAEPRSSGARDAQESPQPILLVFYPPEV